MTPTQQYLRNAIEYAPREPRGPMAKNLRGWWLTTNDDSAIGDQCYYVCARCAARIMDRGCHLIGSPEPVWADRPEPIGVCECCHPA